MTISEKRAVSWMKKYLRYTDFLGAAQLYLRDNFLSKTKLTPDHIKKRVLGHWGTVPGLNLIYAGLNYLVSKNKCEILLVTGPGHGAPAILANVFAEETIHDFYKDYPRNEKGTGRLIHDFSWPHTPFPSHVTPTVPGSILEGGELGYSLSTAYGAALDNPNLIVAAIVGDGESETGPTATAWHSNKFLNPKTSGAVLPIVHINRYKISNPTIYGTMGDDELKALFTGYGYDPIFVEGENLELKIIKGLEEAYSKIREVQKKARASKTAILKPKWPVILLRSPKGWKGLHEFVGEPIEYSFHSHGIPLDPNKGPEELKAVEKWLKSYKIAELLDKNGCPKKEVLEFVPKGSMRIGMCRHAFGGNIIKSLSLPWLFRHEVNVKKRGETMASSMEVGGKFLRDVIRKNPKNFRIMCPDELESNKLDAVFETTKRAYMWPLNQNDENINPLGRVMEMLSEHTLQGWMQGYILTGRHGLFVTYEAFATIISSMVDQYAKFLRQSFRVKWRKPVSSAIYIMTSVGWRQDHNGYSHQNPSFVSSVLQKHGEFCQIYYPSDANSLLAAFEEIMKRRDSICVIVAGKRPLPQWLSLKEARKQAEKGIGIWEWVGGREGSKNPDVVLASSGDYMTYEAIMGIKIAKKLAPELKIRYVNVSELTSLSLGDNAREKELNEYFTEKKPVIFNYHGYVNDIEQILWPYENSKRFSLHGYREIGSTTTPFDLTLSNGVSRYHIAMDLIKHGVREPKRDKLLNILNDKITAHKAYIEKFGDDPKSY